MVFLVKNRKSEQHFWIVRIRICRSTKFQLKLTILIDWTKFTQKGYFHSRYEIQASVDNFDFLDQISSG